MPAVMMTRHIPNALIAIQENARRTLKMLVAVRNVLVCILKNTIMISRITVIPISCP